jgi:hypothetical protein
LTMISKFIMTKSVEDCKALQADINSVQQWCGKNYMQLNIQKNKIISFTRKTNSIHFNYYVLILRSNCIKYLVMLDSKLYFHCHVDFVYSQALRTFRFISYNFMSVYGLDDRGLIPDRGRGFFF